MSVLTADPSRTLSVRRRSLPLFRRYLLDGWRGQIGWSVGIAAVISLYLPLFPSMQSPELSQLINTLPPDLVNTIGFNEISSGAGYTQATFFGLLGFVFITIASISWGSAFIAGAEESGRLELTLAHAVGRIRYALESTAALIVKLLALGLVAVILILLYNTPANLQLSLTNLLAITIAWMSMGLLSGSAALVLGALTGRKSWAIGAGAGVAIVGYGFNAVGKSNADLSWLWTLSPYHWALGSYPLENGFDWPGLTALWMVSIILIAGTTWALSRRDVLG